MDWYKVGHGYLEMDFLPNKATDNGKFGFIGRRQQHHQFDVLTKLKFNTASENEVAGILAGIKHTHHIRLEISGSSNKTMATVYYVNNGKESVAGTAEIPNADNTFFLKLEARGWDFRFYAGTTENKLVAVGGVQDARVMSSEIAKGFTGSYVGMYASSNGSESNNKAKYHWFEYKPVNIE